MPFHTHLTAFLPSQHPHPLVITPGRFTALLPSVALFQPPPARHVTFQMSEFRPHVHGLDPLFFPARILQSCNASCTASGRRLPPPGPQLAPHRAVPCVRPRQDARAFNQPLSWDTPRVTAMDSMFVVRASPRPGLLISVVVPTLSTARCVHAVVARRLPPHGPQLAPNRVPCLRPSADRVRLQPAAELGHLPCHEHAQHVWRALLPRLARQSAVARSPLCTLRAPRSRLCTRGRRGSRISPHTPCALLATRQFANSLSADNKLRIRCAWAGTPAFASAGYGPGGSRGWPSGSCA